MDVALSLSLDQGALREVLARILPGCSLCVTTCDAPAIPDADVLVFVVENASEFPTGLSLAVALEPGCDFEDWLRELARKLSEATGGRTICDGTPFGDDASPYWALIWDAGEPFLADDLDTLFGDGEGGPVVIVRRLPAATARFHKGSLVDCVKPHIGRDDRFLT